MDFGRKRGRPDTAFLGNGCSKKSKEEMDSFTTGVGSKSKPCTKFFSTSGCSFGDTCHFLHYFPGYSAHTRLAKSGANTPTPDRRRDGPFTDGPAPNMKTKMCNKLNTPEGCRFGDKCHFAHSEMELGNPTTPCYEDSRQMGPFGGPAQRFGPSPHGPHAGSFGMSSTAKISIDASVAGAVIGKNGVNSKQICRQTGVKLSVRDNDSDPNQKNIELEGTFDQIKDASSMVREIIMNISASADRAERPRGFFGEGDVPRQIKTKMCEHFSKGLCTFGERCRFAHSSGELRN